MGAGAQGRHRGELKAKEFLQHSCRGDKLLTIKENTHTHIWREREVRHAFIARLLGIFSLYFCKKKKKKEEEEKDSFVFISTFQGFLFKAGVLFFWGGNTASGVADSFFFPFFWGGQQNKLEK